MPQPDPDFDAIPAWDMTGDELLSAVAEFLARFIAYPSEAARVAHVLWVAHTHAMDKWESTPRLAFLSPEPESGKSRALEVTELLVPRPVHSVNCTPSYLFRKVSDEAGAPTILFDEIDTVFGPKAKDNEEVRGLLNAGHRRGAVAGRCVARGTTILTEELPAYCAVALAGLDDLPDTIMTRSLVVRMRRRSSTEVIEPFRHREHAHEGHLLRDALATWVEVIERGKWPEMPAGICDRNADCWEALFAVAEAAGGEWPTRSRLAAVALVRDVSQQTPGMGVQLLTDIRAVFDELGEDKVSTEQLLKELIALEEAPWGSLRGRELDARGLASRLRRYEIKSKSIRTKDGVIRGYAREDFYDAWSRYLPPSPDNSATSATDVTVLVGRRVRCCR
jgi:hypothetical protein